METSKSLRMLISHFDAYSPAEVDIIKRFLQHIQSLDGESQIFAEMVMNFYQIHQLEQTVDTLDKCQNPLTLILVKETIDNCCDNQLELQFDEEDFQKEDRQTQNSIREIQAKDRVTMSECPICLVPYQEQKVSIIECGHAFHKQCLSVFFSLSITSRKFPLKCPVQICSWKLFDLDIIDLVSKEHINRYRHYIMGNCKEILNKDICPNISCITVFDSTDLVHYKCKSCGNQYCLRCNCVWHEGLNCQQYQWKKEAVVQQMTKELKQLVKQKQMKKCPGCKSLVERNQGCDAMTCFCGTFFCFKCGEDVGYDHGPCSCRPRGYRGFQPPPGFVNERGRGQGRGGRNRVRGGRRGRGGGGRPGRHN